MRKQIGVCAVDSGQIMICDPCYLKDEWQDRPFTDETEKTTPDGDFSYAGACKRTLSAEGGGQLDFRRGNPGVGVVASTRYGDGVYPVYATYSEGRITKVEIVF